MGHFFDNPPLVPGALYVRDGNRLLRLPYDDLLWAEADDAHLLLHTPARTYSVRSSLRELERRLPAQRFARVRRNALVQLHYIDHVDLGESTVWVGGREVPMGRTYRDELLARLNRVG